MATIASSLVDLLGDAHAFENALSGVPTDVLAQLLARRTDLGSLVDTNTGRVQSHIFTLRRKTGVIACADMVPVAVDGDGRVWGGCIKRGGNSQGPFYGRFAYIGGVVGMGKTLEESLRYHANADLGFEVELPLGANHPVRVSEYYPMDTDGAILPGFQREVDKHSVAGLYMATLKTSTGEIRLGMKSGIQEALGFFWFNLDTCPPAEQWAYDQCAGWVEVVKRATQLWDCDGIDLPLIS